VINIVTVLFNVVNFIGLAVLNLHQIEGFFSDMRLFSAIAPAAGTEKAIKQYGTLNNSESDKTMNKFTSFNKNPTPPLEICEHISVMPQ
jgi:hypothetical protein